MMNPALQLPSGFPVPPIVVGYVPRILRSASVAVAYKDVWRRSFMANFIQVPGEPLV